jgi:hypothetical protein
MPTTFRPFAAGKRLRFRFGRTNHAHHGFGKLNLEVTQGAQLANANDLSAGQVALPMDGRFTVAHLPWLQVE